MGRGEAAYCLGVTLQYLHILRRQPAFPEPVAVLRCGPIWRAEDIEMFAATRNRIPGRKKKQSDQEVLERATETFRAALDRLADS